MKNSDDIAIDFYTTSSTVEAIVRALNGRHTGISGRNIAVTASVCPPAPSPQSAAAGAAIPAPAWSLPFPVVLSVRSGQGSGRIWDFPYASPQDNILRGKFFMLKNFLIEIAQKTPPGFSAHTFPSRR